MRKTILRVAGIAAWVVCGCYAEPGTTGVEERATAKTQAGQRAAAEYSYAYWKNGWRKHEADKSPNILCIESSQYGLRLDMAKLDQPRLGLVRDGRDVESSLEAGTTRLDALPEGELAVTLELDGTTYRMVGSAAGTNGDLTTVPMFDAGLVAQQFDIRGLVFQDDAGNELGCYAELGLMAWPNSLTFNLTLKPTYRYQQGLSEGVVGSGLCIIDTPLEVPHATAMETEEFSLECWVKSPEAFTRPRWGWYVCKGENHWADGNFGFWQRGANPVAVMNIGGGRDNVHTVTMSHRQFKDNDWNQMIMVYDGSKLHAYVNGKHAGTREIGKTRTPNRGILRIGQRGDGKEEVTPGLYDQVRVWNRALDPAEIQTLAVRPDQPAPEQGLVLEKGFDGQAAAEKPVWENATVRMRLESKGTAGTSQWHWNWGAEKQVLGAWQVGQEQQLALVCNLPGENTAHTSISARVTTADSQAFPVAFDQQRNCLVANTLSLQRQPDFTQNGTRNYDEFLIELTNPEATRQTVPFMLVCDGTGITGSVPILCDEEGVPTGIRVQSSKNWHKAVYRHPYMMLPAEPGTTRYLLRYVFGFYGSLPAASHSQLSLVGYGGNGRWDQLAIGCWGETICFDVDMSLTMAAVTDIRGLMLRNGPNGTQWGWTDAGHGGDWLVANDQKGDKLLFNDLKTAYLSHGPCLTDARYRGYYGAGREVALRAQVQTLRTNDYARTFQTLTYAFEKPVSAANSALYALSHKSITNTAVYGNRDGVIAEIVIPDGAKAGDLLADQVTLAGDGPWWVSFPGAMIGAAHEQTPGTGGGTGCRALVIRGYEAAFGGKAASAPTISLELGQIEQKLGIGVRLEAPKGVSAFQPGDRVDLDMELITLPRVVEDYYGQNQAFIAHLKENPQSWKTVYREAKGNDLLVEVAGGNLLHRYPVIVQATRPEVVVDIKGGVGYVPIRFEGLNRPDGYGLYEIADGQELELDQSVHGNDFWQVDYEAATGTWKWTFNLPLDGKATSRWVLKRG